MKASDVPSGQGMTGNIGSEFVAVYNSGDELIVLRNVCTHRQCQTEWSADDNQWQCPCHGSIYTAEGQVVRGPAREPLDRLSATVEDDEIKLAEG